MLELYDDHIGGVVCTIPFTTRLRNCNLWLKQFDKLFRRLKKKELNEIHIDIWQVSDIMEYAINIGYTIDRMTQTEKNVFDVVLQAYFYKKKKQRWII